MKTYTQLKIQLLRNKAVRQSYNALGPEFEIAALFIKRRIAEGFTQKDLARRIGTKQSAVSRFESGEYNPTLNLLHKMAQGLNAKVKVTLRESE
ncbi:MAG: helix-turn-helix transcriptional regulator [Parcubacteria group bacterium]|nr:helix-turn-helix transcriptional regulator [Parcubacteria group bacterium]